MLINGYWSYWTCKLRDIGHIGNTNEDVLEMLIKVLEMIMKKDKLPPRAVEEEQGEVILLLLRDPRTNPNQQVLAIV